MHKILFVIDNLGSGGAQNQLTILAVELKKRNYEVEVFIYYADSFFEKRLTNANIKLHFVPKKNVIGFSVIKKLVQIVKRNNYTAIISFLDTPNFYAALAKKLSKTNAKLIISYRSKTEFDNLNNIKLKIKEFTNNTANFIVSNSNHEKKRWVSKYPSLSKKWFTIYNAVDADKFQPIFNQKNFSRRHQGNIICIGSLGPHKNGLVVVDAIKKANLTEQVKLKWIGNKVHSIPYRHEYILAMEAKVKSNDLENIWTWQESIPNIEEEYKNAKCLILASKTEGLPNVVCEALYCGLPCIVSNVLDHPVLVQDGYNGFLFNPDDANDLANAIAKICALNQSDYQEMCLNAYNSANHLLNQETFTNSYINLIKSND